MLKKAYKPLLLSAAATVALVTPATLAASCTDQGGVFSVNVNRLTLVHRNAKYANKEANVFSRIEIAWQEIAKQYNALGPTERGVGLDVRSREDFNITDVSKAISDAINARDDLRFNLIYDYPGVLGNAIAYNGIQPLATAAEAAQIRNTFTERVVANNDQIVGVPSGGLYVLPLAKSSEFMGVNKPLAALLFNTAKAHGYISANNATLIQQMIDEQAAIVDGDYAFLKDDVKSPWKAKAAPTTLVGRGEFDDRIFSDAELLINFAIVARGLFDINPGVATRSNSSGSGQFSVKDYNVIGIDSVPNFMFTRAFSLANGDYDKFLFHKGNSSDTRLEYSFLTNANSEQRRNFDRVYNKLVEGARADAVFVKRRMHPNSSGESYANIRMSTDHLLAFAITSTASYEYNYTTVGATENPKLLITRDEMAPFLVPGQYGANNINTAVIQGASLMALRANNEAINIDTQRFIKWFNTPAPRQWAAIANVPIGTASNFVTIPAATDISPAERFTQIAGYLYPSKTILNSDLDANAIYTEGQRQTARQFELAEKEASKYALFEEPVDFYSSLIRNQVESNLLEQFTQNYSGGRIESVQDIINKINIAAGF